jgi:hypothetical protein
MNAGAHAETDRTLARQQLVNDVDGVLAIRENESPLENIAVDFICPHGKPAV